MPLAFSFFSSKRHAPPSSGVVSADADIPSSGEDELHIESSSEAFPSQRPFPKNAASRVPPPLPGAISPFIDHEIEVADTMILPTKSATPHKSDSWLPDKREARGLAALAVDQSSVEAPPLNRRSTPQNAPVVSPFPVEIAETTRGATPVSSHWQTTSELIIPETSEALRLELRGEIEQVKGDLFGAAMGVSALKDRLDGLESQMTQKQAAASPTHSQTSREAIESWIAAWFDEHLPAALDRAVTDAQTKSLGSLSTQTWFRQPVSFPAADRHTFLSQPPLILASTPV